MPSPRGLFNKLFLESDDKLQAEHGEKFYKQTKIKETSSVGKYIGAVGNWQYSPLVQQPKNISNELQEDLKNSSFSDVTIEIEDKKFNCNSIILHLHSSNLQRIPWNAPLRLNSSMVSAELFPKIYAWMLGTKLKFKISQLLDFLSAADALGIRELCNDCWKILSNVNLINEMTAFFIYIKMLKTNHVQTRFILLNRVKQSVLSAIATKEFLSMSPEDVREMLSQTSLSLNNELEVFYAIVLWTNNDWANRKKNANELMECVRWAYFPRFMMGQLIIDLESFPIEVRNVAQNHFFRQKLRYELAHLAVNKNNKISPRNWIADKNCPYFDKLGSKNPYVVSYDEFLNYLEIVASKGLRYWKELMPLTDAEIC